MLEQLVELAGTDPEEKVRFAAIWAFRADYALKDSLLERLVPVLSRVAHNSAEPFQNKQIAIASLATLMRRAPKHLTVLMDICQDKSIASAVRVEAIGELPWASKYSSEIRPILGDLAQSDDEKIRNAGLRGLRILDKRSH